MCEVSLEANMTEEIILGFDLSTLRISGLFVAFSICIMRVSGY